MADTPDETPAPVGYHRARITPGVFGDSSKIFEEVEEFSDALCQGIAVMAIMELADIVGAIRGYLAKHHPSITLDDLEDMAEANQRVFESGYRGARV